MDPVCIAAIAAPFVAKGTESFSKTAGERLVPKVGELYQIVINKFKGDASAEQTVTTPSTEVEGI